MITYYFNDPDCDLLYVIKATNEEEALNLLVERIQEIDTCDYHYIRSRLRILKDYEVVSSLEEDMTEEEKNVS